MNYPDIELLAVNSLNDIRLTDDDLERLNLAAVDMNERWITVLTVDRDCALKEFIEKEGLPFIRGRAFYEFTYSVESIPNDKELICMLKVHTNFFHPCLPHCLLGVVKGSYILQRRRGHL